MKNLCRKESNIHVVNATSLSTCIVISYCCHSNHIYRSFPHHTHTQSLSFSLSPSRHGSEIDGSSTHSVLRTTPMSLEPTRNKPLG